MPALQKCKVAEVIKIECLHWNAEGKNSLPVNMPMKGWRSRDGSSWLKPPDKPKTPPMVVHTNRGSR